MGLKHTNISELQFRAKGLLPKQVYDYYAGGADDEVTLADNLAAFRQYKLLPRVLVDVSHIDCSMTLLRHKIAMPVLVAPMAMQQMAHPDGELAVARASAACKVPMMVSTMGTYPMTEVARMGAGSLMLFQLYVVKDRAITQELICCAERAGYAGLVVTVDAPLLGNREADEKNGFALPDGMTLANLDPLANRLMTHKGAGSSSGQAKFTPGSGLAADFCAQIDASLTWEFVGWLRTITRLPLFVKGVLHPADAQLAVDAGADGIVVSNHGGRQVDTSPAALDMLPSIVACVRGRALVLVDGGIRRGTDVLKALALGADAVLVGRPLLWGLALGGQAGVESVLNMLERELRLNMTLCGCRDLRHVTRDLVLPSAPAAVVSKL